MKVKVIYNPVSGAGAFPSHLDKIIDKAQSKNMELSFYRRKGKDDLPEVIKDIIEEKYDRIIVSGGDGSVNQLVNELAKNDINLPLGIIPAGTANDLAFSLKIPFDIEEAMDIALGDNIIAIDIGRANDKYFVNVASAGLLSDVSQKTDVLLKNNLGKLAYYLTGVGELPHLRPFEVKIASPDFTFQGKIYFILVMNGKAAGGFTKVAPYAALDDTELDIIIFKECYLFELAPLFIKVMRGEHVNSPHVNYFKTNEINIDTDSEVGTDLDGEKGPTFPLKIECLPEKLQVLVPSLESSKIVLDADRNSMNDVGQLLKDLPRHNAFNYRNRFSLDKEFFKKAEDSLNNGYFYLVLSNTGSAAAETIKKVTRKEYSHTSLAFDEELELLVSYNGGEDISCPGLNAEQVLDLGKKEDASILVYRLKANRAQKERVLEELKKINSQGSSYNVLGLFLPYSYKENIMVCSQFVYSMLKVAGLDYFHKQPEKVRPTDFVELDYDRKLELYIKGLIKDFVGKEG